MNTLANVITYVRRIIKSPSDATITDNLIIDYINRFWTMDVDARLQLFDLKTKYQFMTTPGVDKYNMPLYSIQTEPGPQNISYYPVYQGFVGPVYIQGVPVALQTQKGLFYGGWNYGVQNLQIVATGDGTQGPYTLNFPILPNSSSLVPQNPPFNGILRGHIDINGLIARGNIQDPPIVTTLDLTVPVTSVEAMVYISSIGTDGQNVIVSDSGQFLDGNVNLGLLMQPGNPPLGNQALPGGYRQTSTITGITQATQAVIATVNTFFVGQFVTIQNVLGMFELNGNTYEVTVASPTSITINVNSLAFTPYTSGGVAFSINNVVNYFTGVAIVTFPAAIPAGNNINVQCYWYQSGLPRSVLFYNNVLTFRAPPALQYLVELDAFLSPAAFLSTSAGIPFAYMSEYIARGAARKILSDVGDAEQMAFYEPLFKEQEMLVWKRSQRQWTATRTETIYSMGNGNGFGNGNFGGW